MSGEIFSIAYVPVLLPLRIVQTSASFFDITYGFIFLIIKILSWLAIKNEFDILNINKAFLPCIPLHVHFLHPV